MVEKTSGVEFRVCYRTLRPGIANSEAMYFRANGWVGAIVHVALYVLDNCESFRDMQSLVIERKNGVPR